MESVLKATHLIFMSCFPEDSKYRVKPFVNYRENSIDFNILKDDDYVNMFQCKPFSNNVKHSYEYCECMLKIYMFFKEVEE